MHVEYLFRPQDVAGDVVRAQAAFLRLRPTDQVLGRPRLSEGDRGEAVEALQQRLNVHGADPPAGRRRRFRAQD
ncbi:hypothetical protein BH23CHL7_BH23CHL7_24230 [soil metagenome]